jgi:DNA-binding transcriptional LysR family regulator
MLSRCRGRTHAGVAPRAPLPLGACRETFTSTGAARARLYDAIIAACQRPASARASVGAPRVVSTLNFVAAGLGVSIVPASLERMRMDGIVYRRLRTGAPLTATLNLASRQGETSAAVERFLELAKQTAKKLKEDRGAAP